MGHARDNGWEVRDDQLDDKQIVRRMVLKRVIYGVDKNPMAVELAKVALWLHTFTVGAPLSFLDHHLRCGDSLFGETVHGVMDKLAKRGGLILHNEIQKARASTTGMEAIELNTDADIAGAKNSAAIFEDVTKATAPLASFMSLLHAFEWMDPEDKADKAAINEWLDGNFGEPFEIAAGRMAPQAARAAQQSLLGDAAPVQTSLMKGATGKSEVAQRFAGLLSEARGLMAGERYHHWEIAFPGVWNDWQSNEPSGGFDAVVGNPPWDRIKFQEVEWFAARKPEIAHADTAARRKSLVEKLKKSGDPLAAQYDLAAGRAAAMLRMARGSDAYPLLSGGDVNIYSLFVERALGLVKPTGLVGLLTPVGIATDITSSEFFSSMTRAKRVGTLFVFENKGGWLFKDVHHEDKPTAILLSGSKREFEQIDCGFFIRSWDEFADSNRRFAYNSEDFLRVNPNTGTAPLFRTRRDAELVAFAYKNVPVLVDRTDGEAKSVWPVKYVRMFDMTNDSHLFHTRAQLQAMKAYPVGGNRWKKGDAEYLPLYEGKMVQIFNHRYSSVERSETSVSGQGKTVVSSVDKLNDPAFLPTPYYWVQLTKVTDQLIEKWCIGFNDTCNVNNERTVIAGLVPLVGYGNTLPVLTTNGEENFALTLLCANLCSIGLDYVARQKIQARHLNKFILEQLPVIPPAAYSRKFGKKSADDIIKAEVLALTYTAHDMEPFARDMGFDGPPFAWDEMDRLKRKAKLDAIYFHLYGITSPDDVAYIYSTFPIVQREEEKEHGRYLSRDYCLMYMNALEAGDPDAEIVL